MKKFAPLTATLTLLIASSAFANGYDAPKMRGELTTQPAPFAQNLTTMPIAGLPTPTASVGEIVSIPTRLINANQTDNTMLDVTLLDDFIDDISPNARHYPPIFPNATSQYNAYANIKHLVTWLTPYADNPNASFDVLLRMAKLTIMGRNLGASEYTLPANTYISRTLKINPNHDEANFLYGMMLSEGGGIKEGKRYLDKAAALGYLEAEQSLIQSDLIGGSGDKTLALTKLKALAAKHPDNTQIAKQVQIVENGGYYIWKIEDNDISIKPVYWFFKKREWIFILFLLFFWYDKTQNDHKKY